MDKVETTSMSSKGQVVIPQSIREDLGLEDGEKFTVFAHQDTIILKKITRPSIEQFNEMLRKTRAFVKTNDIKKKDLANAIKRAKQDEMRTRH